MEHRIKVEQSGIWNCYLWICACGKEWRYGASNLDAVNAHIGTMPSESAARETWAEKSRREAIYNR